MNILSVSTRRTETNDVFEVHWRTGLEVKGCVRVTMNAEMPGDRHIAAELATIRFLLEDRNVCGHDKAGKNLTIRLTYGAIKKLVRTRSDKEYLSPYANFLRTRFAGANLEVESRPPEWIDETCESTELTVAGPAATVIAVGGIGNVELSSHAVRRYIERFDILPHNAWRRLRKWTPDATAMPALKSSLRQRLRYPREASFAISPNRTIVLVVMPPKRHQVLPCLVTIYPVPSWLREDLEEGDLPGQR